MIANHNDVFDKASFLMLISFKTLRHFPDLTLSAGDGTIGFRGSSRRMLIGSRKSELSRLLTVRADEMITLKANSLVKVPVDIESIPNMECDGFLVENIPEIQNKYNFEVSECIVNANRQSFIVVANATEKDITIYPGTQLAKAKPVKTSDDNVCVELPIDRPLSDKKLIHTGMIRKVWVDENFQ